MPQVLTTRPPSPATPGEWQESPNAKRFIQSYNPEGHITHCQLGYVLDRGNHEETEANKRLFIHAKRMRDLLVQVLQDVDKMPADCVPSFLMHFADTYNEIDQVLEIVDGGSC